MIPERIPQSHRATSLSRANSGFPPTKRRAWSAGALSLLMVLGIGGLAGTAFADVDPSLPVVPVVSEAVTPEGEPPTDIDLTTPQGVVSAALEDLGDATSSGPVDVTLSVSDPADPPVDGATTAPVTQPAEPATTSALVPAAASADDSSGAGETVSSADTDALASALSVLPAMNKNADGSLTTLTLDASEGARLGTADGYAILGGSTITNTGVSTLDGDIGLHPGTAVTGFEACPVPVPAGTNCVVLTGAQNLSNEAAAQAKADLLTAYTNLVGLEGASTCTYIETELGGQTLQSGVYCSNTGTFEITGALTLDGPGEFIFLTGAGGSTLVTASASQVLLTNGADACNVYFQVGSSATLGANSDFQGNILAQESISVGAGADVNGRLLALTSAVTLINDTVTSPSCGTTTPPDDTPPGDTGGTVVPPGDTGGTVVPPGDTGVTIETTGQTTNETGSSENGGTTLDTSATDATDAAAADASLEAAQGADSLANTGVPVLTLLLLTGSMIGFGGLLIMMTQARRTRGRTSAKR